MHNYRIYVFFLFPRSYLFRHCRIVQGALKILLHHPIKKFAVNMSCYNVNVQYVMLYV
jgi:hypothetical protein